MPDPIFFEKRIEAFGYPAVGHCIYCGTTARRLTKEHIIGKGIGGNVTLDKCSCSAPVGTKSKKRCSEITRDVESFCFREMLGNFRHHQNFPISERKADLPLHLIHPDGTIEVRSVNAAHHTGMMTVPIFDAPGVLVKRKTESTVSQWAYIPNPDAVKIYPERTRVGRTKFDGKIYARMLAKIAHSLAAAEKSLAEVEYPFLPDFILGRDNVIPCDYYVGCLESNLPAEDGLHRAKLFTADMPDGRKFLVANIRLFARNGAPQYHVVIGRLKPNA